MAEHSKVKSSGAAPEAESQGSILPSLNQLESPMDLPGLENAQMLMEERLKLESAESVSNDASYLASLIRMEIRALEKRLESATSRQLESLLKQCKNSGPISSRLPDVRFYHSHHSSGKETAESIDLDGSLPIGPPFVGSFAGQRQRSPPSPPSNPVSKRVARSESKRSGMSETPHKLKHFLTRQFSTLSAKDDRLRSQMAARKSERRLDLHLPSTTNEEEPGCCLVSMCQRLLKRIEFEACFAIIILVSVIIIGVEVDMSAMIPVDNSLPIGFEVVNAFFTLAFLLELLIRLIGVGFWDYFVGPNYPWHILDLLLVLTSLVELGVYFFATFNESLKTTQMRAFRILRITRSLRGVRVMRLLRIVSSLRMLIFSIISTMRSLGWTIILLSLIVYSFGILFTQSVVDHCKQKQAESGFTDMPPTCEDASLALYWSSIPRSMYTLLLAITNGLSWHQAVTPLSDVSWLCVLAFITYIIFTYFAVLNVVTGVFCQSAIEGASADKEMSVMLQLANKRGYINTIKSIFQVLDQDDSLEITMDEFEQSLSDPRMQAYMESVDIHALDAWTLFKIIDSDNSGSIDIEEFVSGCLQLRGSAKAVQLAKMSQENKISRKYLQVIGNVLEQIQINLKDHHDMLQELKAKSDAMESLLTNSSYKQPLSSLLFKRLYQQPSADERRVEEDEIEFRSAPASEGVFSDSERVHV